MRSRTFAISDPVVWRALRKPERMQLFEAVRRCGGCSAQQLARSVGMSSPLTHYHLKLLAAAGLLHNAKGKRYRDKGGLFTATTDRIDLAVDVRDTAQVRRARSLMDSWTERAASSSHAADGPMAWQHLEALTKSERRAVQSHMRAIEAVLERAGTRRGGTLGAADATHAVTVRMQALSAPALPSPRWRLVPRASGRR